MGIFSFFDRSERFFDDDKEEQEEEEEVEEEPEVVEEYPHNHLLYDCIFPSEKVNVNGQNFTLYRARFKSLYEMYEYLKSNPKTNNIIFHELKSETNDSDFAGKPYKKAVEDLISEKDEKYDEFLRLQKHLNQAEEGVIHKYKTVKTVAGGHLSIPDYVAGAPLCYTTEKRVSQPKFIKLYACLSYCWSTSKKQVFNRALIITSIIKALEKEGYNVDLETFEVSTCSDEIIYISVDVKKYGKSLNMSALYKSLCHVEFLRRILFRVLETLDVTNDWSSGYGRTASEEFVRKLLKMDKNSIFFDEASDMYIEGDNLSSDFKHAIEYLDLDKNLGMKRTLKRFKDNYKNVKK